MWVLLPPLVSKPQHQPPCVSPPCRVLGPVCADSAPVVTQPPYFSASLGKMARLTCTSSRDISVGSYYMYWDQKQPGRHPRYLLYYYPDSDKHQGPGVPSRFSGSKDTSANAGLLLISRLQAEDEDDYYCAIGHSSASHSDTHSWGIGVSPTCAQRRSTA
uniref:Ig-like domain-containing protein n=1 Tax=Ailuropoda melanoleuca TaxID=9646 RepID=G1LNI1_AILME